MRIFHLAVPADWHAALEAGTYEISTRGLSLQQVGFIHCSRADQVAATHHRFYADVADVQVLTVDTDLLDVPWREDHVPEAHDTFPHVYGPIGVDAVVDARPYCAWIET